MREQPRDKTVITSVMLVDDNYRRAAIVEASLRACGFAVLATIPTGSGLLFQMQQHRPDVIIIALESPDRDVLESLSLVSTHNPTPIVMFSEQQDADFIADAIRAGVTAYQVEGIQADKVKAAVNIAVAQFTAFTDLRSQLGNTRRELDERRLVSRATGLVMDKYAVTEAEAFTTLRKLSMDTNRNLGDVARELIYTLTPPAKGHKS